MTSTKDSLPSMNANRVSMNTTDITYKDQIVYLNQQVMKLSDKLQRIATLANDVELAYEEAMQSEDKIFCEFIKGAFAPTMEYIRQVRAITEE